MQKHWKAILGVTVIFLFGWISGVLSSSLVNQHRRFEMFKRGPAEWTDDLEKRVTRNLNLDAKQEQQIHALILDTMQQRDRLQTQLQPQLQAIKKQMNQQIEALLNPSQKETFRANLKTMRKRAEKVQLVPPVEKTSPAAAAAK